ncbi:MAG: hypothetical protein OEZ06_02000 [Myxococcales bacterium]|nr:hypothetical protein [Myxococcales bacterium]
MVKANWTPDDLAKHFFRITIVGAVLYIGLIVFMMSSPDKKATDDVDYGVTVARQ